MIKLTLHQQSNSQTFLFTKDCITIGEGQGDTVDISLKGLGLHQNHIKLYISGHCFYISNQANDPFITLNGLPFGKKKLVQQDVIQIKDCLITIDEIQLDLPKEPEKTQPHIESTEQANIEEQICDFPSAEKLAKEDDLEGWFPSDLSELNIEDMTKTHDPKLAIHKSNMDENYQLEEQAHERKPKISFFSLKKLKWLAVFAVLLFIIAGAVGVETYLRAASKSGVEENKAAESLADLAMALTYAKVFHVIPQNHNYSEPEFLKNNLTALLPANSILTGTIDTQGLFSNCSYLYRFYSEQGLSRFLIIAQPAPSISQWLFPKDAILIDSSLMDLRKISDLKNINSLLAAAKPFEGTTGRELSEEIKSLKVLSLPQLAKISKKMEFAPPRILKYLKPGAENLIYNAPRYFLFTEPLLKKLLSYDLTANSKESILALQSELERFSGFDNLILYAPQGLQAANKANKVLYSINHATNFLSGYLLLSPTEEILSSRLIIDTKDSFDQMAKAEVETQEIAEVEKPSLPLPFTHPLNKKFENFQNTSSEALLPLVKQMAEILEELIQKNDYDLKNEFFLLLENYQNTRIEQKKKLARLIQRIEQQYPEMTSLEIYQYIKRYQLENLTDYWESHKHQLGFLLYTPFSPLMHNNPDGVPLLRFPDQKL